MNADSAFSGGAPVVVTPADREDLLRYAARLVADMSDAVAVAAAAVPLLEWLEAASGEADLHARRVALKRHHANCCAVDGVVPGGPAGFVDSAAVLHAFLIAGSTEPEAVPAVGRRDRGDGSTSERRTTR